MLCERFHSDQLRSAKNNLSAHLAGLTQVRISPNLELIILRRYKEASEWHVNFQGGGKPTGILHSVNYLNFNLSGTEN